MDREQQDSLHGWLRDYARIECKTSTADGYEGVLRQYLRPKFTLKRLDEINRDHVKALISDLVAKDLSRNTVRNAICVIRGIFNQAIEGGLLESNPAVRLGRFTRTPKRPRPGGLRLPRPRSNNFSIPRKKSAPSITPCS